MSNKVRPSHGITWPIRLVMRLPQSRTADSAQIIKSSQNLRPNRKEIRSWSGHKRQCVGGCTSVWPQDLVRRSRSDCANKEHDRNRIQETTGSGNSLANHFRFSCPEAVYPAHRFEWQSFV